MKILFTQNGVVIGHGTASDFGASISSSASTADYEVPDNSPVDVGWIVTLTNGAPAFFAPTVKYPVLTPMQFYLAFAPAERIAIKKSTDPDVMEFWATYELAAQLNHTIDPNLASVQEGLAWLATPTSATPTGPGILASTARIAQISQGIPQ